MTMLHLCSGKNKEGYLHALLKSFDIDSAPVKSSLSKYRKKISYLFFADHLKELLDSFRRPTWKGLHLYAVDGFEVALPRTEDVLNEDCRGRRMNLGGETYYPHLYMVHTYDVLSRTTKALSFGPASNEIKGALANIEDNEIKSLTMYDRFYCNGKIMRAHFERCNYFLIRCRRDKFGTPLEVKAFFKSDKTRDAFNLGGDPKMRVYLYKLKHRKQKETIVLATNKSGLSSEEVRDLYRLRWEVENSFRDFVETLPMEQWHSKDTNGIYQEIYMRFWIMNFARIHQFECERKVKNPLAKIYSRSNFKLVLDFILSHIDEFIAKSKRVLQLLKIIIERSVERRKRYSRSRPRQIRFNPSNHKAANIIFDEVKKNA
jgi:hypothetical protein